MDAIGFLGDLEAVPDSLTLLADAVASDGLGLGALPADPAMVLFLGMGSSAYAASAVATRLRAHGVLAVAELASSALLPPAAPGLLVVVVSASGESAETVAAMQRYAGVATVVGVTEVPGSQVAAASDVMVPLLAGPEPGGVACRSYRHTLAVLLAVAERVSPGLAPNLASSCRRAAESTGELLRSRDRWVREVAGLLDSRHGSYVVAPAERYTSAQQSALMLREGPRRAASACETGDWSHVDVYLTTTLDYRMLLFPGSSWDVELLRWTSTRGTTVVSVGRDAPGARVVVPLMGYDDPDVALLSETTVAELVAQHWWATPEFRTQDFRR